MEVGCDMDGKRSRPALKNTRRPRKNTYRRRPPFLPKANAGETLVEAIVSFALVIVVLLGVMAILQTAIALNRHALTRMEELETDTAAIEADKGPASTATPDGSLTLDFGDSQLDVPVQIRDGAQIDAYMPVPGGYLS